MLYPRYIKHSILQSFKISPIVLLIGPRRSGKTTLMEEIASELNMNYITFDTLKQIIAAQEDPEGFISAITKPCIIDEVQRVPEIALPIKLKVDQEKKRGFFGLTGSANPLVALGLNDSLAGRMFIINMFPLSQCEINNKRSNFLDLIFQSESAFQESQYINRKDIIEIFSGGGYPDVLSLDFSSRNKWFDNLLTTILERDVKDITSLSRPRDLAKLLNILANRSSNLLNLSELSRISAIPYTTLNNYMVILESLFLVIRQYPWHSNRTKRLIKMPKIYFGDSGLLMNQLKAGKESILEDGRLFGLILENFVFLELKKLSSWLDDPIDLYHFRTQTGIKVDIVLENRKGQIVGIEVKASESITSNDWKGLDALKEEMKEKMVREVIIYCGKEVLTIGKNRIAIPLSVLWNC
jgi:uncharacterized protein